MSPPTSDSVSPIIVRTKYSTGLRVATMPYFPFVSSLVRRPIALLQAVLVRAIFTYAELLLGELSEFSLPVCQLLQWPPLLSATRLQSFPHRSMTCSSRLTHRHSRSCPRSPPRGSVHILSDRLYTLFCRRFISLVLSSNSSSLPVSPAPPHSFLRLFVARPHLSRT